MLYTKNVNGFMSVCASHFYPERSVVYTFSDKFLIQKQTRESIMMDNGLHVDDPVGRYINHSCNPSVRVDGFNLIAIKDIAKDEEITFDYKRESPLSNPFVCSCCGTLIS